MNQRGRSQNKVVCCFIFFWNGSGFLFRDQFSQQGANISSIQEHDSWLKHIYLSCVAIFITASWKKCQKINRRKCWRVFWILSCILFKFIRRKGLLSAAISSFLRVHDQSDTLYAPVSYINSLKKSSWFHAFSKKVHKEIFLRGVNEFYRRITGNWSLMSPKD